MRENGTAMRRSAMSDLVLEPEEVSLELVGEIGFPPGGQTDHCDDDLGLAVVGLLHYDASESAVLEIGREREYGGSRRNGEDVPCSPADMPKEG